MGKCYIPPAAQSEISRFRRFEMWANAAVAVVGGLALAVVLLGMCGGNW